MCEVKTVARDERSLLAVPILPRFRVLLQQLAEARGVSLEHAAAVMLHKMLVPDRARRQRLAVADRTELVAGEEKRDLLKIQLTSRWL